MKTTHIKNIVIWALVVVNFVFLGFWIFGNVVDYRKNAESNRQLQILFEKKGISMDISCVHVGGAPQYTLESSRSVEKDKEIALALLGSTQMTVQGGIIYTFVSDEGKGRAIIKNSGDFTVSLEQGVIPSSSHDDDVVRQLLKKMQIDAVIEMPSKGNNKDAGSKIKAVCTWKERQIFDCIIEFEFEAGSLRQISGKYAPDITILPEKTEMSSCATALMAFLGEIISGRYACKEILSVDAGYFMTASTGRIEPTWRIRTDSREFYVNALSNQIEAGSL